MVCQYLQDWCHKIYFKPKFNTFFPFKVIPLEYVTILNFLQPSNFFIHNFIYIYIYHLFPLVKQCAQNNKQTWSFWYDWEKLRQKHRDWCGNKMRWFTEMKLCHVHMFLSDSRNLCGYMEDNPRSRRLLTTRVEVNVERVKPMMRIDHRPTVRLHLSHLIHIQQVNWVWIRTVSGRFKILTCGKSAQRCC